ncbi:MAG: hypothetical protein ABJL67_17260 [Sulfitobacter sp.]
MVEGYTGSYSPFQRFVRDLKQAEAGSGDAFKQSPQTDPLYEGGPSGGFAP